MKPYLWIPFALLLGLMIGGWGPRSELRAAKSELKDTLKLLQKAQKRSGRSDVNQVTRMLGIEESTSAEPKTAASHAAADTGHTTPTNHAGRDTSAMGTGTVVAASSGVRTNGLANPRRGRNMEEELDEAMELWKLRSDIARSTFLSNAKLSDEAALNFDVLIEAMNIRLGHAIETWAEQVKAKDVQPEDGIRLMNEITGAMVLTYDEMDRKLPNTWRKTGGKGMQLMDFIDPSVARPLIGVEDKLNRINRSFEH